jgi:hypothetical protein
MANDEIKKEIEEHLSKAVELHKEIEALTGKILEELEKVKELSQKTEEIAPEFPEKKEEEKEKEVEEIPEIEVQAPEEEVPEAKEPEIETPEGAESRVDFSKELEKVQKIKEMLGKPEEIEPKKEERVEEKREEKIEGVIPTIEKIETPTGKAEVSFDTEEKAEPVETPPSEQEIEVAIGEETLPEAEKPPEIGEETVGAPPFEKAPEISIEEEKPLEVEEPKPEEAPPVEIEPEKPLEEKPIPEEKEIEIEESDTMQTMFSGRWKKHWQDKPGPGEEPADESKEEPAKEIAPDLSEKETVEAPSPEEKVEEEAPPESQPEVKIEPEVEMKPAGEAEPGVEISDAGAFQGRRASDAIEYLEKYKKTEPEQDGEVVYYEHNEKIVLDSECIITALKSHLQEGKKLYEKLTQTESPKDQFFVKQEIIKHQEALRGIIEITTKLLEKENCSLPQFTMEIISETFLKEMLENLSMQNWSNQDDFTFFDEYAKKIEMQFEARIDPKVDFLKSIIEELGI